MSALRLAALGSLFGRFPRTVRDLAQELGKEARVEIAGGDVGADQHVLDVLGDPLLHLVRNALDHGLEPPAAREAIGKPRHGTIRLRAAQAGRFIEVIVADDGRGIDPTAVGEAAVREGPPLRGRRRAHVGGGALRAAVPPGLLDEGGRHRPLGARRRPRRGEAGRRGPRRPRRRAERGRRGTEFVLRVPVSTALIDALVVEAGAAPFAVPAAWVERVSGRRRPTSSATGERRSPCGSPRATGRSCSTSAASRPAAGRAPASGAGAPVPLVLVAEGERRLALRVDRFLGEHALVQEALDPFLKGPAGRTGTAVLEDGRLAAILSVVQVFRWAREDGSVRRAPARRAAAARARAARSSPRTAT